MSSVADSASRPTDTARAAGAGERWLDDWLTAHREDLIAWRRHIHRNPELSRQEFGTTAFIAEKLRAAGLDPQLLPAGTGLYCDIGPADADGKRMGLRADLDALPMNEESGLDFASTVPGVAHTCGHDVHTAVVLGAGLALAAAPRLETGVRLIFQPAEEVMPGGALDVIAAGVLSGVSRIFALHCDPHLQVGTVGVKAGPITSAADIIDVHLSGPGGHTSRPQLTTDLVGALGRLITDVPALLARRVDPRSRTVMVWGSVEAGRAANAIPKRGTARGTVRTGEYDTWAEIEPIMRELVHAAVAPTGVQVRIDYHRGMPPVDNEEYSATMLRRAAGVLGPDAAVDTLQSSGGEDFAWYLEKVPGAMGRLGVWPGSGPVCDIHQPDFYADERALEYGVRLLVHLAAPPLRSPNLADPRNPAPPRER